MAFYYKWVFIVFGSTVEENGRERERDTTSSRGGREMSKGCGFVVRVSWNFA